MTIAVYEHAPSRRPHSIPRDNDHGGRGTFEKDLACWRACPGPRTAAIDEDRGSCSRKLAQLLTAEGEPLPPQARAEIEWLFERLALVKKQIKAIEAGYDRQTAEHDRVEGEHNLAAKARRRVQQLVTVVGMGAATAVTLVVEVFMRSFADRRALARFVGLTGTPDESGSPRRDRAV